MTPTAPLRRIPLALATWVLVGVVLLIVAGLVVAKVAEGSGGAAHATAAPAPAPVVQALAAVPARADDLAGAQAAGLPDGARTGPGGLSAGGRPLVVWVGGVFCPYCAVARWAVVAALARFGTFSGLGTTTTPSDEAFSGLATLDFSTVHYRSATVAFAATEAWRGRLASTGPPGQAPDQPLTALDRQLLGRLPAGTPLPLLDVGGRLVVTGAGLGLSPGLLEHLSLGQIATDLGQPGNRVGMAVLAAADLISAALCQGTGGRPASVCHSTGVTAAAGRLAGT